MVRAKTAAPNPAEEVLPMPPFTIKELRDAIPPHCFQRSLLKSSLYLARDLVLVAILAYMSTWISVMPWALRLVLWPTYWLAQGFVGTGVWVIAHECGHQAFSESKTINDAVGLVLHSVLLVPYHSWRITHGSHHKNTNHMDRDHVFVPKPRSAVGEALEDSPLVALAQVVISLTAGWWLYLMFNFTGQKYDRRANHYEPSSPLFKEHQRTDIIVSDIGIGVVLSTLAVWAYSTSVATVLCYYFVPYMVVNACLVTITLLQHTHVNVPHYRGDEWTFIRGALATIDRSYGPIVNSLQHNIMDSHVAHHLFSQMPHYHAIEATPYLAKKLGVYYNRDDSSVLPALYEAFRTCIYVDNPPADVLVWRSRKDIAKKN